MIDRRAALASGARAMPPAPENRSARVGFDRADPRSIKPGPSPERVRVGAGGVACAARPLGCRNGEAASIRPDRRVGAPAYGGSADAASRFRDTSAIRRFSIEHGAQVARSVRSGRFPSLSAATAASCSAACWAREGEPASASSVWTVTATIDHGNYDTASRLGTVAGMDLTRATGLGEAIRAHRPAVGGPWSRRWTVSRWENVDRSPSNASGPMPMSRSAMMRLVIQDVLALGVEAAVGCITAFSARQRLDRVWLHVDLDVLSASVMPAVDSTGTLGLDCTNWPNWRPDWLKSVGSPVWTSRPTSWAGRRRASRRTTRAMHRCVRGICSVKPGMGDPL